MLDLGYTYKNLITKFWKVSVQNNLLDLLTNLSLLRKERWISADLIKILELSGCRIISQNK